MNLIRRNGAEVETRDYDGDIATGTIRLNTDGLEIRDQSENWVTLNYQGDEIDRFRSNLITSDELRSSLFSDWIDQSNTTSRRFNIFNNDRRPVPNDLVLLDMKVENIGDYQFKTTLTYIDKKNYQEIKQEYISSVTLTNSFNLSGDRIEIKVEQMGEMKETRKDI